MLLLIVISNHSLLKNNSGFCSLNPVLVVTNSFFKIPVSMACSKHGSRGIDAIWNNGSIKLKEFLAAKLSSEENKLNSNQYGKFVSQNLGLNLFKR